MLFTFAMGCILQLWLKQLPSYDRMAGTLTYLTHYRPTGFLSNTPKASTCELLYSTYILNNKYRLPIHIHLPLLDLL